MNYPARHRFRCKITGDLNLVFLADAESRFGVEDVVVSVKGTAIQDAIVRSRWPRVTAELDCLIVAETHADALDLSARLGAEIGDHNTTAMAEFDGPAPSH